MNFNPEQMKMAMDMMKNMKPEDMQNMMKTVQENPQMYQQAMNMMQGGGVPNMPRTSSMNAQPNAPLNVKVGQNANVEFPELGDIAKLKAEGNELFQIGKFEDAGSKYLYAILDLESLREKLQSYHTQNHKFLKALNELEISCRNNYCSAKTKLEEFDLIIRHAQRVIDLDTSNGKAHYNLAQAFAALKNFVKASFHVEEAFKVIPNQQLIVLREKINEALKEASELNAQNFSDKTNFEELESQELLKGPIILNDFISNENLSNDIKIDNEDFPIKEEGTFENLEKYFSNENDEVKTPKKVSNPPKPETKPEINENITNKNSNATLNQSNTSSSMFERYWQVLLGILLGLIIAKILKF